MNIPRQKTKFELYSLVNLSYNDNDKMVVHAKLIKYVQK